MSLRGVAPLTPRRGNLFCLTIKLASKAFTIFGDCFAASVSIYRLAALDQRWLAMTLFIFLSKQRFNILFSLFISSFTDVHVADVALFIDEIERRPVMILVGPPGSAIIILGNCVLNIVTRNRIFQIGEIVLI